MLVEQLSGDYRSYLGHVLYYCSFLLYDQDNEAMLRDAVDNLRKADTMKGGSAAARPPR